MPIFEWYIANIVGNNRHQKDTCYDRIGLQGLDLDTIQGSTINTIGGFDVYTIDLKWKKIFTLTSHDCCN